MSQTVNRLYKLIKAKFPGRCASTNLPITVGEEIAYYPHTKRIHKVVRIYPGADMKQLISPQSLPFKFVEAAFNQWFDHHSPNNPDLEEMYFGPEAIYEKAGAIQQSIIDALEIADESQEVQFLHEADLACAWEG